MNEKAAQLLEGAGDLHVHASPSLVPNRRSNVWRLIEACEAHKMAFAVLKWHHGESFSTAEVVNEAHAGPFALYGGIVLNQPVGGLNPAAVDVAVTLGAKVVWLPTLDAEGHGAAIGQLGGFPFQEVRRHRMPERGIRLLDENGTLKREMREILTLLDGTETVLASGHVAVEEIVALEDYIRREGIAVHLLVNHVDFAVPALTAADIERLESPNVWFELAYFTVSALGHSSIDAMTRLIASRPRAQFVLASDSGQAKNPIAPEGMLSLVTLLLDKGVDARRLDRMLHHDARSLLMLGS